METCTYPSILELSQYQLSYHTAIVVESWYGGIFDNNAQSDQSTGCTFSRQAYVEAKTFHSTQKRTYAEV